MVWFGLVLKVWLCVMNGIPFGVSQDGNNDIDCFKIISAGETFAVMLLQNATPNQA